MRSFSTNVSDADVTLQVRYIGYRKREVRVSAGESVVDVALARDVFKIEEIVVTGQATGVERRNLANAVATVGSDDIRGAHPPASSSSCRARWPGRTSSPTAARPGGGLQVRLRGITSVNADAQPLYVVDGIVVSDVAIPSNQNAVTAAAAGGNPSPDQDGQVNRIADLNPADIESIEILKGASAAAIYGGRASNGVVIITTKRGRSGKPQVSISQRLRISPSCRTRSGRGRSRPRPKWTRVTAPASARQRAAPPGLSLRPRAGARRPQRPRDRPSTSAAGPTTPGTMSPGRSRTRGIIATPDSSGSRCGSTSTSGSSPGCTATPDTNVLHTKAQRGLTNNDNTGTSFYVALAFTPSFTDLRRRPTAPSAAILSCRAIRCRPRR